MLRALYHRFLRATTTSARYISLARARQHFRTIRPIDDSRAAREKKRKLEKRSATGIRCSESPLPAPPFGFPGRSGFRVPRTHVRSRSRRKTIRMERPHAFADSICQCLRWHNTTRPALGERNSQQGCPSDHAGLSPEKHAGRGLSVAGIRYTFFFSSGVLFSGVQLQKDPLSSLFVSFGYASSYNLCHSPLFTDIKTLCILFNVKK